ncbi:MAG: Xaa-Pro peptidase family protein [Thermodesulfobacteriota bacterium]
MDFAVDWTKRIDFDLLRKERTKSLNEQIKRHGLDALLCFKAENIRYMTGYRPLWWPISFLTRNAGIMAPDKEPLLFPTSGCYERCRDSMYWMTKENIRPLATMEDPGIVEVEIKKKFVPAFDELGITSGKIGIDHVSMLTLLKLQEAFPNAQFVNGDHCVLDAQVVKNSEEIKCMRVASRMASIAMDRAMKKIGLGVRECEILAEAMHSLYSNGMEVPQCSLIVTSGDGTAPLRRFASDRKINWNELVFMDLGGCFNGYFSDFTRTVIFGKPSDQHKKIYRAVHGMMMEIHRTMIPGNTNSDVNNAARQVVIDHGFKGHDYLGLLGHSIGVTGLTYPIVGEVAAIGSEKEVVLKPGMIFSMEPGIFIPGTPGGGGVRIEDTILITEEGNEVLTQTPYDENLLA